MSSNDIFPELHVSRFRYLIFKARTLLPPIAVAVGIVLVFDYLYVGAMNWLIFGKAAPFVSAELREIVGATLGATIGLLGLTLAAISVLKTTLSEKSLTEQRDALISRIQDGYAKMVSETAIIKTPSAQDMRLSKEVLDFEQTLHDNLRNIEKLLRQSERAIERNRLIEAIGGVALTQALSTMLSASLEIPGLGERLGMDALLKKIRGLVENNEEILSMLYRYEFAYRFLRGLELPFVLSLNGLVTILGALLVVASSGQSFLLDVAYLAYVGMLAYVVTWFVQFIVAVAHR